MRPGRRPKPTAIKLLEGNPGKRPLNKNEPLPKQLPPKCPSHLDRRAKREWKRMAPLLENLGLLTEIDGTAFGIYCQAYSTWVEATEKVKKTGMIVKAPSGYPIQNPYLAIANKAVDQMRAFLAEFGMMPSSRSRISVPIEDEIDDFLD